MNAGEHARQWLAPAAGAPRRWSWTLIAVLALGVLAIAQLLWTNHASGQKVIQKLKISGAMHQLEVSAALAHLWLMEFLSGDASVHVEEVWLHLDRALDLAQRILDGAPGGPGEPAFPRLDDPELRRQAEAVRIQLAGLRDLAAERYRHGAAAGASSEMDRTFDRLFVELLRDCDALNGVLAVEVARSQERSRRRLILVVGAWIVVVAAAVAVLWDQEKRRRRAESAVRTSHQRLSTTLASLGEGVIATGLDGAVSFMNPMAEKLTGWPLAEAAGRPIVEVFSVERDDGEPLEHPVAAVLRTGQSVAIESYAVMVDRRSKHRYGVDQGAAPIRGDGDQLLGAVLVFRDVSQRRQTREALRQRDAELQQALKMEAVGRLAGGIAHDVNNYLGAIRGYCEVARRKIPAQSPGTRQIDAAMDTAIEAAGLVRQLLAFSRKQPLRHEVIDLGAVVGKMERMMRRLLGDDVTLSTVRADGLWSVEADPSQVEQILLNLLVNSRDAMSQGGEIRVRTDNVERGREPGPPDAVPGRYVRLSVRDTGSGMTPEVRQKIFEPFFTTKPDGGASGLGLATVYGIVQQGGGFVTVDSEPGRGTTFEIYLPASDAAPAPRPAAGGAGAPAAAGPARILLVEDNPDMRAATADLLRALGHRVLVAEDGDEALRFLLEGEAPVDLLITDVVMPGMSGPALFRRVQQARGDVRCLFISGYAGPMLARHGLDRKSSDLLSKPFTAADLAGKIGEILDRPAPR